MVGVGLAFEIVLDRRVDYQPGWASVPLAAFELGAIMGIVYALDISAPLTVALAFFAGLVASRARSHARRLPLRAPFVR
jgi:hypothetical protein